MGQMGVYIPPDAGAISAMKLLAARVTATESAHPDSVVIVLSDFNHTNLKKFLPRYKQHVDCATRNNKTLDHCYTVHKNAYNALVRAHASCGLPWASQTTLPCYSYNISPKTQVD